MIKYTIVILILAAANAQHRFQHQTFLPIQRHTQQQTFLPAQTQVQRQVQQQIVFPSQTQFQQQQFLPVQQQRQVFFNPMQQGIAFNTGLAGNRGLLGGLLGGGMNSILGGFGRFHDSDMFDNNDFLDSRFDRW